MTIINDPSALRRLAALICERYDRFYKAGMEAMHSLFRHQKLRSGRIDYPVELRVGKRIIERAKHGKKMDPRMAGVSIK